MSDITKIKEIKIGWKRLKVVFTPDLRMEDCTKVDGYYDPVKREIHIDDSLPEDLKSVAFYHECIHAMLDALGRQEDRDNENLVDGLANMFYQVMNENFWKTNEPKITFKS